MKRILLGLVLCGLASPLWAQQPPIAMVTNQFQWDVTASSVVEAVGWTYKYYLDGETIGRTFPDAVTCQGASPLITCQVNVPVMTQGGHRIQLTASNEAGESPKSIPFDFVFSVVPSVPINIRIK